MQQRASLCRSLVHEPRLLLLDEPFAALDAFTVRNCGVYCATFGLQRNSPVVLVTHDLREAVFLADTVYVMSKRPGRIVAPARTGSSLSARATWMVTYTSAFADIVHDLRGYIGRIQNA